MSEPFIGEIIMYGFNFAPRGWALCDGQILPINQNQALFSLLGTTYGGDGRTTFGLPDFRGSFPTHFGTGPGLTPKTWGQRGGSETETLNVNQIPSHSHTATVKSSPDVGNSSTAQNAYPSISNDGENNYSTANATETMAADSVAVNNTGGNQAHNNLPPFLVVNFSIALIGIFPSRS